MKIAYVLSESACVSPYSGVRVQADTWAKELERQGHRVIRVSPWEQQDWQKYDAIHLFGYCTMLNNLSEIPNKNIVFSPIIDSFQPIWKYRLVTYWGSKRLRLTSHNFEMRLAAKHIKTWCVRTQFEYEYVRRAYGISPADISVIPLSYRITPPVNYPKKDSFCLHVSKITDKRKNVERLVDAAIKYHFRLVLAGSVDQAVFEKSSLKQKIEANTNISYLGRVSDERLFQLYCSAKVFALPSIGEGVGMVALEAAACGCDIVITNIGGPKNYYGNRAKVVNPYDTNAIGEAVLEALSAKDDQPYLMTSIQHNYCLQKCVNVLADLYRVLEQTICRHQS